MKNETRVEVRVIEERPKALKVESNDGRRGWIQRRWFDAATSTVAAATFEKAAGKMEAFKKSMDEKREYEKKYHDLGQPVRETEKAIAFQVILTDAGCEQEVTRLAWFPKSLCDGFKVVGWFLSKKLEEIIAEFPTNIGAMVTSVGSLETVRF